MSWHFLRLPKHKHYTFYKSVLFVTIAIISGVFLFSTTALASGGGDVLRDFSIGGSNGAYLGNVAPSGSYTYQVPIQVPPGRNGLEPGVVLNYDSQDRAPSSIYGFGWSDSIPYIQRTNKEGTNELYDSTYFMSTLSGELKPISVTGQYGTYGARIDTGDFLKYEYKSSDDSWEVTDKTGTIYTFGAAAASRQDNPSDSTEIYKWMLSEVRDLNDNYVTYEYYKNSGQIYPDTITYTGNGVTDGIFTLVFSREARSDADTHYTPAFAVTTNYRIDDIQAKVSGTWRRKYELAYTTGENGVRSMLSSVTESGQDESSNTITLPATSFTYHNYPSSGTWTDTETDFQSPVALNEGTLVGDVNGDGLPDILQAYRVYDNPNPPVDTIAAYINDGDGWTEDSSWEVPSGVIFMSKSLLGNLTYNNYDLVDINGDGYGDLVSGSHQSYLNAGSGWTTTGAYGGLDYGDIYDEGRRFMDVNGDGLVDQIIAWNSSYSGSFQEEIQINTGTSMVEQSTIGLSWSLPVDVTEGVIIGDINGDGLDDFIQDYDNLDDSNLNSQVAYVNTGDGWVEDSTWESPDRLAYTPIGGGSYSYVIRERGRIVDENADGLNDIGFGYANTGDGWATSGTTSSPLGAGAATVTTAPYDRGNRIVDLNGDGIADLLQAYRTGGYISRDARVSNDELADRLTSIATSDGASITISYDSSAQLLSGSTYLNPDLPYPIQVVTSVAVSDGMGNTDTTSYSYEGGEYYYDSPTDRRFAGFHKVITTDDSGNVTKQYFHQGNSTDSTNGEYSDDVSKIGQSYRTEVYDGSSNKYAQTVTKWENYDLGNGRDFVKKTRVTEYSYDGDSSHKDTSTEYAYDNTYGNVTSQTNYGEVTTSSQDGSYTDTGSDKFTTTYTYAANTTDYVVGLPSSETLTDQSSTKVSETKYYYDSQAYGSVTDGNLTKQEQWETGSTYIDTEHTYNSYGLVTQEKDPRDKATNYTYDTYNLYPTTVTNTKSQATTFTYDYSSGAVKVTTDPNSRQFETTYDALDRPKLEKVPDLTTPTTLVTKTEYTYTDSGTPRKVQVRNYLDTSTSFDIYNYYDGLGRLVQTRKEAEDTNVFTVSDISYHENGQVYQESLPYFSSGLANTSATTNSALLTTYTYDPLDRVKTAVNTLGTTSYSYDDWETVITDALSNTKDLHHDAYGQLIKVEEHNGASVYDTNYEYNGLGNLTKITDEEGNIRNFTYNGLGRRLTAQDLHAPADGSYGTWTYSYDDSGNLTQTVDPKSQTVNYTYDDINRVLTEDYTGDTGTEVTYTYDTGTNGVGRLASVDNGDADIDYTYNAVGGIDTETKTINATAYVTEYDYDLQGNVTLLTYPDDAEVQYTYNTAGLLESVERKESGGSFVDVVVDYDYGPTEAVIFKDLYNDVDTRYTYDPNELYRLKNITTIDPPEEEVVSEEVVEESVNPVVEETTEESPAEESVPAEETIVTAEGTPVAEEVADEPTEEPVVEETHEEVTAEDVTEQPTPEVIDPTPAVPTDEEIIEESSPTTEEGSPVVEENSIVEQYVEEYEDLEPIRHEMGYKEIVNKRTENSVTYSVKTYDNGDEERVTRTYGAPIFYKVKGAFERIDTRFRTIGKNLKVTKAPYSLEVPEDVEGDFLTFSRGDLAVGLGLVNQGQKIKALKGVKGKDKDTKVNLKGLIGPGIDVQLRAENDYVAKDVIIKSLSSLGDLTGKEYYELVFKLDIPADAELLVNGEVVTEGQSQSTTEGAVVILGDDTVFIYPTSAFDSDKDVIKVKSEYRKEGESYLLVKRLPVEWLTAATYPVTTDAIVSYYSGTGDGRVWTEWQSSWSNAHDATTGDYQSYTGTSENYAVSSSSGSPSNFAIYRTFLPFDTSGLDDAATISDATLSIYVEDKRVQDSDGNDYVAIVQASQSSTSSLSTSDFSQIGTIKGSAEVSLGSINQGERNDISLNSTGLGWISTTGWTKLGLREGHDIEDDPIVNYKENKLGLYFADQSGTWYDPYLEISYSVVSNTTPSASTALQTEDVGNPNDVSDGTPEFSAIYEDTDSGDTATHYQIQVIADGGSFSSPLWDSTKTALTTNITEGNRSEDISYGGSSLSQNGTKYYWRIKFWDDDDAEGSWTDGTDYFRMQNIYYTATTPYVDCLTAQSGTTNPTGLKCGTPVFSAVFTDVNGSDNASKYQIQVNTASDFTGTEMWDSGSAGTSMPTTADGGRSGDLVYAGDPLAFDGTTYYWRIKFWSTGGAEGAWSSAANFATYSSEAFQDIHYTYDAVGNITKIVDSSDTDAAKTVDYTYDDLYRLTKADATSVASGSTYTHTYTYDSIGNFTNKSDTGNYSYAGTGNANPHAATTVNGTTYTYDSNGNLTADDVRTYTWNYNNTMASVAKSGSTYSYEYDYSGQRTASSDGTTTTDYANKYYNDDGSVTTKHIYGNGELLATVEDDSTTVTVYYLHPDHLGGTSTVTNGTPGEVQAIDYLPFGEIRVNSKVGSFDEQRKFTGHEYDSGPGLTYANARYYHQDIGRFVSVDPASYDNPIAFIFDPQQLNTYSYTGNNPMSRLDTSGLNWVPADTLAPYNPTFGQRLNGLQQRVHTYMQIQAAGSAGEFVSGLTPGVADYVDFQEVASGRDYYSGETLSTGAKALTVIGALLPYVGGRWVRGAADEVQTFVKEINISKAKYGDAAQHIEDAQKLGHPDVLTIDRANAAKNRREALQGVPSQSGLDRDEYPPAVFKEGGQGSSVRLIGPSENRGAGACIGAGCRDLPDGAQVKINVTE